jgi:hypothetical protein
VTPEHREGDVVVADSLAPGGAWPRRTGCRRSGVVRRECDSRRREGCAPRPLWFGLAKATYTEVVALRRSGNSRRAGVVLRAEQGLEQLLALTACPDRGGHGHTVVEERRRSGSRLGLGAGRETAPGTDALECYTMPRGWSPWTTDALGTAPSRKAEPIGLVKGDQQTKATA